MENKILAPQIKIEDKILIIRGQHVMIDRDLAELYGVETKRLNEQVRRNIERFPEHFMFQLTKEETLLFDTRSKSQIATLNAKGNFRGTNVKKLPYAFTEQGVAMLASVLKSDTAVQTSIMIMDAFVALRHFLQNNSEIFTEINYLKRHVVESDKRIDELFDKMDRYKIEYRQGIFFKGQIFDAYAKFESFIAEAEKEIVLIDNYVDLSVLERLSKKQKNVKVTIYTHPKTEISALDIQKFNEQYPSVTLKYTENIHDRFLIIDSKMLYHIGASLKDLAKKCFGFEIMNSSWITEILRNL
ncbi:ORF6N domain-containing protein [bacterium]|nr:ORF6N domain-containing protein [bacterium]